MDLPPAFCPKNQPTASGFSVGSSGLMHSVLGRMVCEEVSEKDFKDLNKMEIRRVRFPSKVYDDVTDFPKYLDQQLAMEANLMTASWTRATLESADMIVLTSERKQKTNRKHGFLGFLAMTCFVSDLFFTFVKQELSTEHLRLFVKNLLVFSDEAWFKKLTAPKVSNKVPAGTCVCGIVFF